MRRGRAPRYLCWVLGMPHGGRGCGRAAEQGRPEIGRWVQAGRPARVGGNGHRLPGQIPLRARGRGEGGARPVRRGPRLPHPLPPGDRGRSQGERRLHRTGGGRRSGSAAAVDGDPVRPRPFARRPDLRARPAAGDRTAAPGTGVGGGPPGHPPCRCRAPRPQASERPDGRRRPPRHRLRHLPGGGEQPAHRDRPDDRHAALHVPGTAHRRPHRRPGLRRLRARRAAGVHPHGAGAVRRGQPLPHGVPGGARRTRPGRRTTAAADGPGELSGQEGRGPARTGRRGPGARAGTARGGGGGAPADGDHARGLPDPPTPGPRTRSRPRRPAAGVGCAGCGRRPPPSACWPSG